jgi:hypothetical protein
MERAIIMSDNEVLAEKDLLFSPIESQCRKPANRMIIN